VRASPKFARKVSEITTWCCTAPRDVIALGATAPVGSVGEGVQEMHLLLLEHGVSVEQVAQSVMEE
jgi:hypothetical protein